MTATTEEQALPNLGPAATAARIAALSHWINSGPTYVGLDFETRGWRRLAKVSEENGEVTEAWLGTIGENQRKGRHKTASDVVYELLDVATSALGAMENLGGDIPVALAHLCNGLDYVTANEDDTEAEVWHRLGLLTNLVGKATASWLAAISIRHSTGQWSDHGEVIARLFEVAAAALDAVERFTTEPGGAVTLLASHVAYVHERAGLS